MATEPESKLTAMFEEEAWHRQAAEARADDLAEQLERVRKSGEENSRKLAEVVDGHYRDLLNMTAARDAAVSARTTAEKRYEHLLLEFGNHLPTAGCTCRTCERLREKQKGSR